MTGGVWFPGACRGGHYEAAQVLLTHGAAVDAHDGDGATPLLAAADAGFDRWQKPLTPETPFCNGVVKSRKVFFILFYYLFK